MTTHQLKELNQINQHEIYMLRRQINNLNKDIEKKDKMISFLAKKVNNQLI